MGEDRPRNKGGAEGWGGSRKYMGGLSAYLRTYLVYLVSKYLVITY